MTILKKNKIIVVCHDAGGAEVVSAYVKANKGKAKFICLAVGPAKKIFLRKGLDLMTAVEPGAAFKKYRPDLVLTGTSWASDIELRFIRAAKDSGIKTAAYLDHWVNYRERFGYPKKNWSRNLPAEIWVGDKYALAMSKKLFLKNKIFYVKNRYFEEIKAEYIKLKRINPIGSLVICEPADNKKELEIIGRILTELSKNEEKVILRLHPAEAENKYDKLILKNKLFVTKSKNNLVEDIASVKTVIGLQSMALVIAAICGKKVICYLFNERSKLPPPFRDLIKVKNAKEILPYIIE